MISYCGYLKDEEQLRNSASGGIATAIAEYVISQTGVVYGVAYDADFRGAAYYRVDDSKDLWRIKGSKYIKARLEGTYQAVIKDLQEGTLVAFFGLPCEVAGLKTMVNAKHGEKCFGHLITVDLICQGPTTPKVAEQYLEQLEKTYRSKVVEFSVRYKNPHWTPPYLRAVFANGKEYCEQFYETDYGKACSLMSMSPCYSCKFKGDKHVSDLTIGDFWGMGRDDEGYNDKGVSIAFVHSETGENVLHELDSFALFGADTQKALQGNPRYMTSVQKTKQTVKFAQDFERHGLKKACAKTVGIKGRLIRLLPKSLAGRIKRTLRG